jgi:hypothetical protein
MMKMSDILNECRYMPKEFRDFHDQKDLFKLIFTRIRKPEEIKHISWVDAHIYTVDVFLWFMAKRGYTLQKARHGVEFINIQEEIKVMHEEMNKQFSLMISK